ncbi:hypothetical protein CJ010_02975 [Azoarcus sp. DD4]|uniref:sensor domain-containing diguanylate cyclase n=1 Tax=Azoarcus sp. DD4 TaxID=2027405 RepID=UPI0011288DB6|nr:sensor domain-containing diguanylate cyclase [Azoarcus sp. DD4]QDF95583.1 hypothetical protein CJ010_02975 [Azoarcus sp. DD4]
MRADHFRALRRRLPLLAGSVLLAVSLPAGAATPTATTAPAASAASVATLDASLLAALGLAVLIGGAALYISRINLRLRQSIADSRSAEAALRPLSTAIAQSPALVVITGPDVRMRYVNPRFTEITGYSAAEALGHNPRMLSSGLTDPASFRDMWEHLKRGESWSGEFINRRKNGELYWEESHISPVIDGDGRCTGYVAVKLDITARKRAEQAEHARAHVLELLARGAPLPEILEAIVRGVEAGNPEMRCSALLLDADRKRLLTGAAPSLPDFYNAAVHGLAIGYGVGSCGTAAYTGERVVVEDIQSHPYWAPYRDIARQADLAACWSEPIRSSGGEVLGTFAIYHRHPHRPTPADIELIEQSAKVASIAIDRTLALEALRVSEERHRLLAENATDVIWTMDLQGRFTYVSPSVEKLRGYTVAEVMQQGLDEVLTPESAAIARDGLTRGIAAVASGWPFPVFRGELEQPCKYGGTVWTEVTTSGIYNAAGEFIGILGVSRDISERKAAEARISYLAHHDTLTNLPNRTLFADRLEHALTQAERDGSDLALMFLDLDHFKPINDSFGHAVGDLLLKEAAHRMQACLRAVDTVARIGGDEFVVLLPAVGSEDDALLVAEKIRHALDQPFAIAGQTLEISSSIGVAMYPAHGSDAVGLARNADIAMYFAKGNGRNHVQLYHPALVKLSA